MQTMTLNVWFILVFYINQIIVFQKNTMFSQKSVLNFMTDGISLLRLSHLSFPPFSLVSLYTIFLRSTVKRTFQTRDIRNMLLSIVHMVNTPLLDKALNWDTLKSIVESTTNGCILVPSFSVRWIYCIWLVL